MTLTLTLTSATSAGTPKSAARLPISDAVRRRALERLYERKALVDELIDSLESYQRMRETQRATCVPFSALSKCS